MADVKIKVDTDAVNKLGNDFRVAGEVALRRLVERGEQLLAEEVPKVTHNLEQGISSEVFANAGLLRGELIISARSGRKGARRATIHYPSGATKQVSLRPQPAFNYAEVVARGRQQIGPRQAKVLLIPVAVAPKDETYLTSGDQTFVLRRRAKATKANPYDQRAAARLEKEATRIADQVLSQFGLLNR